MIFTNLFGNCLPDQLKDRETLAYAPGELNMPMYNQDRISAFLKMKKGCCEGGTPSCGLFKPPTEGPDGLMASLLRTQCAQLYVYMTATNYCNVELYIA